RFARRRADSGNDKHLERLDVARRGWIDFDLQELALPVDDGPHHPRAGLGLMALLRNRLLHLLHILLKRLCLLEQVREIPNPTKHQTLLAFTAIRTPD